MAPKRRNPEDDSEEEFEAGEKLIWRAVKKQDKADEYEDVPVRADGESAEDFKRRQALYDEDRAEDLGDVFYPPCKKCLGKTDCRIDITGLVGTKRSHRCGTCARMKVACSNAGAAKERALEHQLCLARAATSGAEADAWQRRRARHQRRRLTKKVTREYRAEDQKHAENLANIHLATRQADALADSELKQVKQFEAIAAMAQSGAMKGMMFGKEELLALAGVGQLRITAAPEEECLPGPSRVVRTSPRSAVNVDDAGEEVQEVLMPGKGKAAQCKVVPTASVPLEDVAMSEPVGPRDSLKSDGLAPVAAEGLASPPATTGRVVLGGVTGVPHPPPAAMVKDMASSSVAAVEGVGAFVLSSSDEGISSEISAESSSSVVMGSGDSGSGAQAVGDISAGVSLGQGAEQAATSVPNFEQAADTERIERIADNVNILFAPHPLD
ncbi:protein of unknown function [Taphrina deformans PYCC 5710]|uniref:Uncharacterized protein n=1 Tax=Taphrina deformans (strain PYCC 5710 / ATCC 11124 / CBS 356.35 / IMI 108563 / JCM 9778 / NBRC 8474) TaxID=1097556 RepID=R4XPB0_TAPDE|nr:protein of unknown function [Taphrina deformans PYCC 5710]|eukprot:CCG85080.1 protein of unknown function [Taphrina deformans PYCC 5710]